MLLCRGSQLIPFAQRHCVRAVKEMDPKSIGLCPQRFESPRCRWRCGSGGPRHGSLRQPRSCLGPPQRPAWATGTGAFGRRRPLADLVVQTPGALPWLPQPGLRASCITDSVTEWLRSWTRNPLGFARRGSNPLAVAWPALLSMPLASSVCLESTLLTGPRLKHRPGLKAAWTA